MSSLSASGYAPSANRFRSPPLAALASAGAGCALVSVAQAQIIYSGIQNLTSTTVAGGRLVDFDGAGTFDLTLGQNDKGAPTISRPGGASTQIVAITAGSSTVDKLPQDTLISGASAYYSFASPARILNTEWGTPATGNIGYIGFSFTTGGSTYYGWGQVEYTTARSIKLIDWAYNSTPGGSIQTGAIPEPATSAMLVATLALGGTIWWKKRRNRQPARAMVEQPAAGA